MDMQTIKTFLTLAEVKRLSLCAEQLCLTKSALSSRIKQLEQELDQILFQRDAKGMLLTNAGRRFYHHALAMQQRWERARREIALGDEPAASLRLGAHPTLARDLLLPWSGQLKQQHPDLTLHMEVDYSSVMVRQVAAGELDIGLILVADTTAGLVVEQVFEDRLLMVSTQATELAQVSTEEYLYLDWGWGYNAAHAERLPQLENSGVSCGLGALGLPWLESQGGTAYLPERLVGESVKSGQLLLVEDAPQFRRPVFATFSREPLDPMLVEQALGVLAGLTLATR